MMSKATSIKVLDKEYSVADGTLLRKHGASVPQRKRGASTFSPSYVRTVTMCLHISAGYNLNCKYCFKSSNAKELTFAEIQKFIEYVTTLYPHADRYIVDMSGAGEPLLHLDLILQIAKYCQELSDKYVREFLPMIVTNGTLLTVEVAEKLQAAGVLFGVSLDGTKEQHDKNRVFANGKGSYDIVEKNIRAIEHNDYVGAAMTYSGGELLKAFLNAAALLPTVSMKPVRYTDDSFDTDEICAGYDELVRYVLDSHLRGEHKYIFALLNDDDYFGKFLKRVASGMRVYGRCDAGIARFALAGDGKIYCCPAGIGKRECEMGDLDNGIRSSKIDKMWRGQLNDGCEDCFARSACGGECKIVSYNKFGSIDKIDPTMCTIKRHLYALSAYYCDTLEENDPAEYKWLCDSVRRIEAYYYPDTELIETVIKSNGKYTFSQLKRIKDNDKEAFKKLKANL